MAPVSFLLSGLVDYYIRASDAGSELLAVDGNQIIGPSVPTDLWLLMDLFIVLAITFIIVFIISSILIYKSKESVNVLNEEMPEKTGLE